ncbi:mediator of DNA damage checkpoint protein 1-like [Acanthaster planci]|uniref:Mediator of DNA damage checkpoint protein 1-like n=1 Tax=Acanthaster planci TaxID=133434 RepID=A0A8B7ZN94_ACAPL|nr:mediator of DNA damage checkpoint protein 1-like [Acanthaster planci]
MAFPLLNQLVSYPDPLQPEVPTGDETDTTALASETVEDREVSNAEEDEKAENDDENSSSRRLPSIVSIREFQRPPPPGTIQASWLDTSYQKALARVRERIVGQGKGPRNAEEWRYHKAPAPARPDLTRTFPLLMRNEVNKNNPRKRNKHRRSGTFPRAASDDVDDESKVAFLPPLPVHTLYQNLFHDLSSSFPSTVLSKKLRSIQDNNIYHHTYLPFVGTASLHPKAYSETEVREKPYVLPALCPGCRGDVGVTVDFRGLASVDKDEGIGSEIESQGIQGQDDVEIELVKDSAVTLQMQSICFGCALSSTPHYHHSKPRRVGGGFTFFSKEPPKYVLVPKEDVVTKETRLPDSSLLYSSENLTLDDDLRMSVEKLPEPEGPVHEMTVPRQKPTKVPQWILDMVHHHGDRNHKVKHYQDHCYACLQVLRQLLPDYNPKDFSDCSSSGIGTSVMSEATRLEEEARIEEEARLRMEARAREKRRLEEERLRREEYERERRKHLYKAPKAFQPKKSEVKVTETQDPFSKERMLDVPKNEGFKVQKSTKPPTKTVETRREEKIWKEPERFELKKPAPKAASAVRKPPERKERLRPETPPPPPPPPVAKKPTIPIQPKKREVAEPIPSLREPAEAPPKKQLEKAKFVKPPIKKVEKELLPTPAPPPMPVRAKTPPPKKKPVARAVTPPPKPVQDPPKVIERTKPVLKEKPKPVQKEEMPPPPPVKKIAKTEKVDRKPKVVQKEEKKQPEKVVVKKKPPPKEPAVIPKKEVKKEPPLVKHMTPPPPPAPPKDSTPEPTPPPPQDPTPPSPKESTPPQTPTPTPPPAESTPPPPKESTPPPREPTPPPKEPTPPPPPREPTPVELIPPLPPKDPTPPPPEPEPEPVIIKRKKPPRPRPQRKKPPKPVKKAKKKEPEVPLKSERPYMDIPQVPFRQPAPEPNLPKEPSPEPEVLEPEPEIEPELEPEPEPPKVPTPILSPPPPPPKEPEKPTPIVKPSKKTRNAKLPKPAPVKKPMAVKAKKIPDKRKKPKPFVMPVQKKLEHEEPPPFPATPEPSEPMELIIEVPPSPTIPTPESPKEPTPLPEPPPLTPPEILEPIVMKRRRVQYKPKKRRWRKIEATPSDGGSPEPVLVDALDYLAKYCIVHKQRIPHYQHIFTRALRQKGIQVEETVPPSVPTVARLTAHNNNPTILNSREGVKLDHDNASVTTETSGYASVVNDDPVSSGDDFQSVFGTSKTINEEDYVSPINLTTSLKEGSSGDEVESRGNENQKPTGFFGTTMFATEDYIDKLSFQLENLYKKLNTLQLRVLELSNEKRRIVANFTRKEFPEVLRPGFDPNVVEKKSPKGKKQKGEVQFISVVEELGYLNPDEGSREEVHPENDDWVLSRLTNRHWQMLESDPSVRRLDLERERAQEKYDFAQERIAALLDEKTRASLQENVLKRQDLLSRAATNDDFRRKQSVLYQQMNPVQNFEVDVKDLESTLKQVNSYLITEKECQYIYHVLDLPQRHRIDFKLFSVVAALSEKVSRLEPFIRKLINKMNFEALEVKMQQAKELFFLLADEDDEADGGEVPIQNLVVELEAGGLKPEHVKLVVEKFNREGKGTVDFLDFLTYIPLFIDIHENIISDPLNLSRVR